MNDTVQNKTVVVTGVSSGIGEAVAALYHTRGYQVIGLDLQLTPQPFPVLKCNISDEASVHQSFVWIEENCRFVNYLINCAGVFFIKERFSIATMDLHSWESVIRTNLTGTMLVTKYAIPLLEKALGDKAIVNISSDQAVYPRRKNAAYAVSKSGIECLTKLCAVELLQSGIRANAVALSSVRSNFILEMAGSKENMDVIYRQQDAKMPLGLIEAKEAAQTVVFLGSEASLKMTGQVIVVDSGLYLKGKD